MCFGSNILSLKLERLEVFSILVFLEMLHYKLIKATIQSMDAQPSRLQIRVEIPKISLTSKGVAHYQDTFCTKCTKTNICWRV